MCCWSEKHSTKKTSGLSNDHLEIPLMSMCERSSVCALRVLGVRIVWLFVLVWCYIVVVRMGVSILIYCVLMIVLCLMQLIYFVDFMLVLGHFAVYFLRCCYDCLCCAYVWYGLLFDVFLLFSVRLWFEMILLCCVHGLQCVGFRLCSFDFKWFLDVSVAIMFLVIC